MELQSSNSLDPKVQLKDIQRFEKHVRELSKSMDSLRWRFSAFLFALSIISAIFTWQKSSSLCLFFEVTLSWCCDIRLKWVCVSNTNVSTLSSSSDVEMEWSQQSVSLNSIKRDVILWFCIAVAPPVLLAISGIYRSTIVEPSRLVRRLNNALSHYHVAYSIPRARLMRTEKTVEKTWNSGFRFRSPSTRHSI